MITAVVTKVTNASGNPHGAASSRLIASPEPDGAGDRCG
jgi:hypothetical protein